MADYKGRKPKTIKDIIRLQELIKDELIINEMINSNANLETLRALYQLKFILADARKSYL